MANGGSMTALVVITVAVVAYLVGVRRERRRQEALHRVYRRVVTHQMARALRGGQGR